MPTENVRGDLHLECGYGCGETWKTDDSRTLVKTIATHLNYAHTDDLKYSHEAFDTIERGGHNVDGNNWMVERIPLYVTAFDVMEQLNTTGQYTTPVDDERTCPQCFHIISDPDHRIGHEDWMCRECHDDREQERKADENRSLSAF